MAPPLTKARTESDVIKHDYGKNYTREVVTLLAGTAYQVGSVLGRITTGGKYKLATSGGSDGAQNAAGVLVEAVDASGGDRTAVVIVRGPAIVARGQLVFDASRVRSSSRL
jgi:hypothetical protein